MKILVTGALGFVGSHVVEHVLRSTSWDVVGLDRIDETSTASRLRAVNGWSELAPRYQHVWHDLRAPINATVRREIGEVGAVLHLAATAHVEAALEDPVGAVQNTVLGTANLLEWYRTSCPSTATLVNLSTDAVYGPGAEPRVEGTAFRPVNTYGAAKAGAEELLNAYSSTYKLRIAVARTQNVFGERQHANKYIPATLRKVLAGEVVHVHAAGGEPARRTWVHAENVAAALVWLVEHRHEHDRLDVWHVVGESETDGVSLAQIIAMLAGRPLRHELVEPTRSGHERHYALDGSKLRAAGFEYPLAFAPALERTVSWSIEHRAWIEP